MLSKEANAKYTNRFSSKAVTSFPSKNYHPKITAFL